MPSLDLTADIIDVRDIIDRVEVLEALREPGPVDLGDDDDNETDQDTLFAELATLEGVLDDLKGYGGDEQWRGDWYPVMLIADSYFEDYARELAEDIHGNELRNASWPFDHIDWSAAAEACQQDYTSTDIVGSTYWYR
jgi:hypothetical protein